MQPIAEKNQSNGYVGIGAEGQVALPAKIGVNGAAPVGKCVDIGASSTSVTIALLTEVAGVLNAHAAKLNEIRTALRNVGLMS